MEIPKKANDDGRKGEAEGGGINGNIVYISLNKSHNCSDDAKMAKHEAEQYVV